MKAACIWLSGLAFAALSTVQLARCATVTPIFAIPGFNDGAVSVSGLTKAGDKYFGTAVWGGPGQVQPGGPESYQTGSGVAFSIDSDTGKYTVVHDFGGAGDGSNPGSLILFEGKLYGTTTYGGASGGGVVFTLDPNTGAEAVLASLPGGLFGGGLVPFNGKLYGTGETSIFSFDPGSGSVRVEYQFQCNNHDGCFPGGLIEYGKYLFGTASGGGLQNDGTLFRFDPGSGKVVEEHSFGAGQDGNSPNGDLTEVGDIFYGTTFIGGASGFGTIYSFDPNSDRETVLYNFSESGAHGVAAGLLPYNGLLYGATEDGSTYNDGTLFAFDPATSSLKDVHVFSEGTDDGPALQLIDGKLWGSFVFGGVLGEGALFAVDPASGTLTIEHNFAGAQIAGASGLTKLNGSLFGTAVGGGEHGLGSIYKVEPGRGTGRTLYSFAGDDGAYPEAPVTDVGGVLYGTTNLGGATNTDTGYSAGTIFRLDPATRTLTTLAVFDDGTMGGNPAGPMALVGQSLFGVTNSGGANYSGTVFKLDLSTGEFTTIANLPYDDYDERPTGLVAAGDLLYGTVNGGEYSYGSLFSVDPSTGKIAALHAFTGGTDGGNPTPLTVGQGLLYGATSGRRRTPATTYSFDPATGIKTTLHDLRDQALIMDAPTLKGDKLFATFPSTYLSRTKPGVPFGGVVRTNDTDGNTHVSSFAAGAVTNPASYLLQTNGGLFGSTRTSTTDSAGVVFKYVP